MGSDRMTEVEAKARRAHEVAPELAILPAQVRNDGLIAMSEALLVHEDEILAANAEDVAQARDKGTAEPLVDRLLLDGKRISGMAEALLALAKMDDPLGVVLEHRTLESGIDLTRVSVPLGVVAMVYEARPNVTADAAGLCLKTGNASVLRGGSLARGSNHVLAQVLSRAACSAGVPDDAIQYIDDATHEATDELMCMTGLIDVLIPRGGAGLIQHCVKTAKVPVIETGVGTATIYLHGSAGRGDGEGHLRQREDQPAGGVQCGGVPAVRPDRG